MPDLTPSDAHRVGPQWPKSKKTKKLPAICVPSDVAMKAVVVRAQKAFDESKPPRRGGKGAPKGGSAGQLREQARIRQHFVLEASATNLGLMKGRFGSQPSGPAQFAKSARNYQMILPPRPLR